MKNTRTLEELRKDPKYRLPDELSKPKSYAVEVIADSSGEWCGNGCRFTTKADAESYATNLMSRWTLVKEWRVIETLDEPNRK